MSPWECMYPSLGAPRLEYRDIVETKLAKPPGTPLPCAFFHERDFVNVLFLAISQPPNGQNNSRKNNNQVTKRPCRLKLLGVIDQSGSC